LDQKKVRGENKSKKIRKYLRRITERKERKTRKTKKLILYVTNNAITITPEYNKWNKTKSRWWL